MLFPICTISDEMLISIIIKRRCLTISCCNDALFSDLPMPWLAVPSTCHFFIFSPLELFSTACRWQATKFYVTWKCKSTIGKNTQICNEYSILSVCKNNAPIGNALAKKYSTNWQLNKNVKVKIAICMQNLRQ
jgi:hypothetical protein